MDLPALNEENCPPGTPLRPYEIAYGEEQIRQYLARADESAQGYERDGVLHVPPGLMVGAYGRLVHESFHYEAGVHVSSRFEFERVPVVDEPLRITGDIVRLFERNGDKYVTFTVVFSTKAAERIAAIEHTSIYQFRSRTKEAAS